MQLKEISMLAGTELKTKAMDLLVMSHGLRHENINPFIGEWLITAYLDFFFFCVGPLTQIPFPN